MTTKSIEKVGRNWYNGNKKERICIMQDNTKKKKRRVIILDYDTFMQLETPYAKALYVALRAHADKNGQCFPSIKTLANESGMGTVKANDTLGKLEKAGILIKEQRYLENGGQTSNLYTLCDKLVIESPKQKPKPQEPQESKKPNVVPDDVPEFNSLINADQRKEASQVDQADQSKTTQDTSNSDITNLRLHNNPFFDDSQAEKQTENAVAQTKYSMDELKNQYDYAAMVAEKPEKQASIDICMDIISTAVNSKKQTIRIQKEEISRKKVTDKLLKLTKDDILWVISKYEQQPTSIHYPKAYLLTLLYDAKNQRILDCQNQLAVAAAAAPQEQKPKSGEWKASGTRAFEFDGIDDSTRTKNDYMAKVLAQFSKPPEDQGQAADAGEEVAP